MVAARVLSSNWQKQQWKFPEHNFGFLFSIIAIAGCSSNFNQGFGELGEQERQQAVLKVAAQSAIEASDACSIGLYSLHPKPTRFLKIIFNFCYLES